MTKIAQDIMSTDILTVQQDRDLNFAEVLLEAKNVRHMPILDSEKRLVGMLSVRDILKYLCQPSPSMFIAVREIMSTRLITATPSTKVADLAKLFRENNISAVPIVHEGTLVGLVSERDFLQLI